MKGDVTHYFYSYKSILTSCMQLHILHKHLSKTAISRGTFNTNCVAYSIPVKSCNTITNNLNLMYFNCMISLISIYKDL